MLRALFVGLMCVSAVGCKSGDETPKSQPGVAAGKVLEVSGTVTVRHDGVARPLAAGQTVEGADTIETGADGHVVIELAHNLAKWELSANKTQVVRESMAWKLAKNDGTAKPVDQDTAAAGRPAERSAAGTIATAPAESTAAPAPTVQAPPAAAPPPPADKGRADEKREKAVAPPPKLARPRAEPDVAPGGGGGAGPSEDTQDTQGPSAHDQIARQSNAIKACLTKDMPEVDLVIAISAAGAAKVTVTASTPVPANVKTCVTGAIQKIKFANSAMTVKMKVSR